MQTPPVRFTDVGQERVAYQVFGTGQPYLHLSPLSVSLENQWDHPSHPRAWGQIARVAQVIFFDARGMGMSDNVADELVGDIEAAVEDALAVLDAVGVERAVIQSEVEATFAAVHLAVEHPDRVAKLILVNGMAKRSRGDGYDHGQPAEWWRQQADVVRRLWGEGVIARSVAPKLDAGPDYFARFERLGCRPRAIAAALRNLATADVRDLLPRVSVPTLVVHSGDMTTASLAESELLASSIPGATLFVGESSTFFWGGGALDAILAFLDESEAGSSWRELVTLLFTDVVGSTRSVAEVGDEAWRHVLESLDDVVANRARRFGGTVVKQTGDGHLLEFGTPSAALRTATALQQDASTLGVSLRCGIHAGEVERRENGDVGGLTVHIAARVAALAEGGQVLVSRTVADLLGAGVRLADRGTHELHGAPGRWQVFEPSP